MRPRWLINFCARRGWGAACSKPPPPGARVATTQGGCAILWRRAMGKISVIRDDKLDHRMVGIRTTKATIL
eukprot:8092535-Pyramimonas_sp.AAC.1